MPTVGSRVVSVLDSGAEGPGFKSQPRRCRVANCSHPLCLCSPSSEIGSSPLKGCGGNCTAACRKVMAAYRRVYDSRHLQADCQEPGSAPEPYSRVIEYGLPLIPFCSRYSQLYSQEAAAMRSLATSNLATCGCLRARNKISEAQKGERNPLQRDETSPLGCQPKPQQLSRWWWHCVACNLIQWTRTYSASVQLRLTQSCILRWQITTRITVLHAPATSSVLSFVHRRLQKTREKNALGEPVQ